jgi:hypothetical protein
MPEHRVGEGPGREAEPEPLPLSLQARTGIGGLHLLADELGWRETFSVVLSIVLGKARGEPFGRLGGPATRAEELSRKQASPAILLYKTLVDRLGGECALELTRRVTVRGAAGFLAHAVGPLDRDELLSLPQSRLEARMRRISARFFNASVEWDEISAQKARFTVTRCVFPELCRAAGAPEVAALFCQGDAVYFGEVVPDVELVRPHTLAEGGPCCPFEIRWRGR